MRIDIQRYEPTTSAYRHIEGQWVKYDDHMAVVEQLDQELQNALLEDKERIHAWKAHTAKLQDKIDKLEALVMESKDGD